MTTVLPAQRFVGSSVPRSEDRRILTGSGRYVDDIQLPGMLHAAFVRSPVAHALITSVDVSEARALPGVVAVYTGADIQALLAPGAPPLTLFPGLPASPFTILATDKVRLVGDPIVARRSPRRSTSRRMAPSWSRSTTTICDRSRRPPTPSTRPARRSSRTRAATSSSNGRTSSHGDLDAVFAKADRVVSAPRIDQHRHQNVPMECRGSVVELRSRHRDADGPRIEPGRAPREDDALSASSASRPTRCACSAATSAARSA